VTSVTVEVPAAVAGGSSRARFVVDVPSLDADPTVDDVLDVLAVERPSVERRVRDETGRVRRFVNLYVDGTDVRETGGALTPVGEGAEILVIPSVAGG
jgi:molybdopterin synthase sulfur carrier subunit